MNELQIFQNEQFGELRITDQNGEPWFVAKDVCDMLELTNPTEAIRNLDEDEVSDLSIPEVSSNGVTQRRNVNIISESGFYALVFKSRKPDAKRIRKWVTSEVLPSIRKTGSYFDEKGYLGSPKGKGKKGIFFAKAERLYVEGHQSLEDIAIMTGVTSRTLSDWKKLGNWDQKRLEYSQMSVNASLYIFSFTKALHDAVIRKYENRQQPTETEIQVLARMAEKVAIMQGQAEARAERQAQVNSIIEQL